MIDSTTRRAALFFTLALVMIAVGIIVWWRFPEGTLTAQERVEDVCASATYPESFDLFDRATFAFGEDNTGVVEYNVRFNGQAEHYVTSLDGTFIQEAIFIFSSSASSSARSTGPATTGYTRTYTDAAWDEWEVTNFQPKQIPPASSSGSSARNSDDAPDSFCGLVLEDPDSDIEFRHVGEETIDGIATDHYFHSQSRKDSILVFTKEYWLDADGLLRQVRETIYAPPTSGDPGTNIVHFKTYSGWGEENIITAPVQSPDAPAPEAPDATASPKPTSTLAPTPTLVPTPTPTNTPEPTQTPVPATAWLEPDPETITFDGSGCQTFTIHGTGIDRIDFSINAINYPDGPSSTGAVARTRRSTPPAASDACRNTGYEGYSEDPGDTFSLVGCRAGTSIIQLGEFVYGSYVLLRRYTVDVTGGP